MAVTAMMPVMVIMDMVDFSMATITATVNTKIIIVIVILHNHLPIFTITTHRPIIIKITAIINNLNKFQLKKLLKKKIIKNL